jgi:hypothetical protein
MDKFADQAEADFDRDVAMDAPPLVRFDERRMHVRAYNYWASLLGDRSFPSIEDLNPEDIEDFGSHSVLLDFTDGTEDPTIAFMGSALMRECGTDHQVKRISEVPPRTLLSRLTDHYLQIIANEAPIGFEAEFTNQRGAEILYRGILMPFSSNNDTIDFVYGVINWKEVAASVVTSEIERAVSEIMQAPGAPPAGPVWADGPSRSSAVPTAADEPVLDDLGRTLADARQAAADAISAEGRSHQALYRAIGLAHAFALVARARAEGYDALLIEAGIKAQPRSPMTALVKLVFGSGYDKTRLSEFASAIEHGLHEDVAPGDLAQHLSGYPGGLKAYVRDARAARRKEAGIPPRERALEARVRLTAAPPVDMRSVETDEAGLAVVVVRRLPDGSFEALGGLAGNDRRTNAILEAIANQQA